ncbi:MAG: BlaI/MecI/CopY family transcriptional regulator [Bacillota bacterium]|nr:BlaI/MecI/CopY family transcriptional regulator [Bacillota bacterium]
MEKHFSNGFHPGMQGLSKVLGHLESEIMEIIWQKDCEITVRDVFEELLTRRSIAYTTVMTIMGRLAKKKLLKKWKTGKTSYFISAMSRDEFTRSMVGNVVDSLLEDFTEATLSHFIHRVKKEDSATIDQLEKLLQSRKKSTHETGEDGDS